MKTKVYDEEERYCIDVTAEKFARYVEISFSDFEGILSDNYFDVTEHMPMLIYIDIKDIKDREQHTVQALSRSISVCSLYDTY